MKKYLLSLCLTMLAFVGAWAQTSPSVTKSVSDDGKTVTYTCEGNVSSLENSVVTGYTFNQAAVAAPVYKEGRVGGSTVTNGEQYYSTSAYYTMSYTYSQANIPTVDGYILKQNVYQFDGTATYALKASGTGLAAGGSNFYSLTTAGTAVADMSSYLGGEAFTSKVNEGDGIWKFPEGADIANDGWKASQVNPSDTYDEMCTYTIGRYSNPPIISKSQLLSDGYLGQMVSDAATTIYAVVDGNYTKAAGTVYNASAAYVDGVEFASIADVYTETYTENTTTVSTGSDTYYTLNDGEYVVVEDGSVFTGYQTDYFKRDADPVFPTIPQADLLSMNYLDPVMGTASYWIGAYNEIKANSYENVIFVSDGGEKAVINSNVIRYLLWGNLTVADNNVPNTAIKKLDLGGVECSDLNDKSWMIVNSSDQIQGGYAVAKFKIQELTLPLTKAANEDYVVPAGVLQHFANIDNKALTSIVIPNGYTEVAARAFTAAKDGTFGDTGLPHIEEYTFPPSLRIIGEKAFYNNGVLKHVNIPNGSQLTQIWRFAFAGTILDSFDFPTSLRFIGAGAFDNVQTLKVLDFSSTSLTYIGNSAFYSNTKIEVPSTLTFPPTIEYIGPGAFNFREYGDIYFTGEHKAPTCPVGPIVTGLGDEAKLGTFGNFDMAAWSGNTHMGYNGFVDDARKLGGDHASEGYANRENYQNHKVYFTMLHFPAGVTIEEAKTYKDVTRKYITERNADGSFSYGGSIPFGDEKSDKVTKFADHGATEWDSKSYGSVAPGYEDTYLGAQKIWPSQNQWMRAYTTVANGVEWNGKDEYRPEVTDDMIKWMTYDKLQLWDGTRYVTISSNDYTYSIESADAYNLAHFPGDYWNENTIITPAVPYTKQAVDEHNATLDGALHVGDNLFPTPEQIAEHNATLDGVKHENDVQTPGHGVIFYPYSEFIANLDPSSSDYYNWTNNPSYTEDKYNNDCAFIVSNNEEYSDWAQIYIKEHSVNEDLFTADEAEAYNIANVPDYWTSTTVIGTATAEQAAAYNLTLDDPEVWQYGKIEIEATHPSAEDIESHNATIPGLKVAGEAAPVNEALADYISKIAYQSTRRFVLADDGSRKGEDYPTDVKGHNWWTIVFPFNMTKAQVDETFGPGTHVCLFSGVDRNAKEGADVKHITLKFQNDVYAHYTPATAYKTDAVTGKHYAEFSKSAGAPGDDDLVIKAFESYMIYPMKGSQDAVDFKIHNPKIEQGAPWPTVIKANTEIHGNTVADWVDNSDDTEYRFVGNLTEALVDDATQTLKPRTIPQYSYVYAKKKNDTNYQFWFYTGTASAWKVNKCVVQATERDGGALDNKNFFGGDPNGAKQVSLFGADTEETTEIENITIVAGEGEDAAIYNISGQRIAAPQKGLYIKNGKKYIAK